VGALARKQLFCKLWSRVGWCGLQIPKKRDKLCCFVGWLFIISLFLSVFMQQIVRCVGRPYTCRQRMEATRRGGLRARTCQAEKQPERKDTHRKPLLPNLRVDEVMASIYSINKLYLYQFQYVIQIIFGFYLNLNSPTFLVSAKS